MEEAETETLSGSQLLEEMGRVREFGRGPKKRKNMQKPRSATE